MITTDAPSTSPAPPPPPPPRTFVLSDVDTVLSFTSDEIVAAVLGPDAGELRPLLYVQLLRNRALLAQQEVTP
jgi:hypothetical protein